VLVALFGGVLAAGAVPRRPAFLIAAATALGLAGIAVTFDRAAYLALCGAAAVVAVCAAPRARRALVPVLAALLLLAALHGGVRGRFLTAFSVTSNSDRAFIWSRAVEMLRDHPLQGVGFANYSKAGARYYDRADPSFPMRTWAHNQPLSTLVETGPLGLAALVWVFAAAAAALLRRLRSGDRLAPGGLAALAAVAIIAQVHDVFYDTKVMYALWLALGIALSPRTSFEDADEPVEAEVERDPQRQHDEQRRHQQIRQEHAPPLENAAQRREQLE
jgi:O-antigen ligase